MKKWLPIVLCVWMLQIFMPAIVEAANQNELVLAFGSEPEGGWDPIKGSGRYGTPLFQSTLLKRDVNLEVTKDLAEDYQVSEDRLSWTVKLKKDVQFNDGHPLTAEDVVFTYQTAKKEGTSVVDLTNLSKVEMTNDDEVNFVLKEPDISFISKMCSLGIVPKHAYDKNYGEKPIGSGPLEFVEWKKGQQLITKPNSKYYGEKIPFKKITFLFIDSDQAALMAQSKAADVIRISNTDAHVPFDGYHVVALDTIDNRGLSLPLSEPSGEKTKEGYPIGNPITSDKAMRQAISIAINRQQMIDQALNGYGTPASSIADKMPWWNEETEIRHDGDIEGAKEILDKAGWKVNDQGLREKNGQVAQLKLYFAYKDRENIALSLAQQLKQIGIEIQPIYATWDEIVPKMHSEVVLFGWGGYDPLEMYYNYSSQWIRKDFYNPNGYANNQVDRYFAQALTAESEAEANQYWKKAQWDGKEGLSHLGDVPWAWLINEQHLYLVRDGLEIGKQKIQPHGGGWPLVDTLSQWKWKDTNQ